ncbi:MAG: hypothetical protein JST21_07725 [Bacteroidetes bacterium]|nr:hypothetical protein [Bacteroidota bacterium]
MKTFLPYFLITVIITGCNKEPTSEDISRKILTEYVCPENARVEGLKIIKQTETQSLLGKPALQLIVSGEIVWQDGCNETFAVLSKGHKEAFNNINIMLIKEEGEWK